MSLEKCLCVKIVRKNAQETREKLLSLNILGFSHKPKSIGGYVYFPVTSVPKGYNASNVHLERRELKPTSIKQVLGNSLTQNELDHLISSFDIIGDIAIIEIDRKLRKKELDIAKALVQVNRSLKVVLAKAGKRVGVFRLRKLRHIYGDKRTITIHKENNCRFKLDVAKAYFSPRLVFERDRVARLVSANEKVLVMFAGVGPFAITIAKYQPTSEVHAIELNPEAVKYMKENVILNKCTNVAPVYGDVKKIIPKKFVNFADRVLMPLPKGAEKFLKEAFIAAKKGCTIHLYTFANEKEPFTGALKKIREEAKKCKKKIEIVNKRIVKPYAPYVVQIVIDFKVLN